MAGSRIFWWFRSTITTLNSKQVWTTQTKSIWTSPPPSLPLDRRMTAAPGMWWECWGLEHNITGAGYKCLINCMGSINYTHRGTMCCCLTIPGPSSKLRRKKKENNLFFLSCVKSAPCISSRTEPKAPSAEPATQLMSAGSSVPRWFPKPSHVLHLHLTL